MIIRPTGLIRDDGRHKRLAFRDLRSKLGATPKGAADLTPFAGPVLDQNLVGWCTCNTLMAASTTLAAQGTPLGFVPSQRVGYQLALRTDRAADYPTRKPSEMPQLQDRGSQILTMVRVAARYGVVPMGAKVWVEDYERESDCSPDNATDEKQLDLEDVEDASTHLLVGAYEIDWSDRKTDMMLALDAKHSLAGGGFVDTGYMARTASSPPAGAQNWKDPYGGGHCQEICAYCRWDAGEAALAAFEAKWGVRPWPGETLWVLKNSWSEDWARGGYTVVTDAFIDQMWEMFCMSVRVAA